MLNQVKRSVHLWQHDLNHSDSGVLVESRVLEQLLDLTNSGDTDGLWVLGVEQVQQLQVLPWLNVVVRSSLTVNQSLNGVTVVVQDEQVWSVLPLTHGRDLLDSQLQGTVTDKQDDSLLRVDLLSSHDSTQSGTNGETNGTPQDLGNTHTVVWESGLDNTESRGTGLSDDDITLSEPRGDSRPQPLLRDGRVWTVSLDLLEGWDRVGLVVSDVVGDDAQQVLQGLLHLDTWEGSLLDLGVVRVELNDVLGLVRVREGTSVEVRQQSTDRQNQVRRLNSLLDSRLGKGTDVDTTESWVGLVDTRLTHWGDEDWEVGSVDQLSDLLLTVVSGGTGVNQDNWVGGLGDHLSDGLNDLLLSIWVVLLQGQVNWGVQQGSWDVQVDEVRWQTQVDWSLVDVSLSDTSVDLSRSRVQLRDEGGGVGNVVGHSVENSEVTVTQGVVQQQLLGLRRDGWNTNDVQHTNVLSVSTTDTVKGGQLTDTEGGDETGQTLQSGVTVSSVSGVQLVGVTSPSHTVDLVDLVKKSQVEVTGKTEDGLDG